MARMPQIPQNEFTERPDRQVGQVPLPSINTVTEPFREGAQAVGDLANFEEQLQTATDKIQKTVDLVNATKLDGKHANNLLNLAKQLQDQNIKNPKKAVDDFQEAITQMTDETLREAKSSDEALHAAVMLAHTNNSAQKAMTDWKLQRDVRNAGNDLKGMSYEATHGLENVVNTAQLDALMRQADKKMSGLETQLTPDGAETGRQRRSDMVRAWVEQRGGASRETADQMLNELRDPKSFVRDYLTLDDIGDGIKMAQARHEGGQISEGLYDLVAMSRETGNLTALFQANDPEFPSAAFSMRQAVQARRAAHEADGTLDPEIKKDFIGRDDNALRTIDLIDTAWRKQKIAAEVEVDKNVKAELLKNTHYLAVKGPVKAPIDHYGDALTLRHDALKAVTEGKITYATFDAIEGTVKEMLSAKDGQEALNIGSRMGRFFGTETARQAGNYRMDQAFDAKTGIYKRATLEQQNAARERYMSGLLQAAKSGGKPVTKLEAGQMAQAAMDFEMGK